MKKILIILASTLVLSNTVAFAHPHYHADPYYHNHYPYSSYNNHVYLVRSDNFQSQEAFKNCDKHSLLIDTTVNYYSNGTRRTFNIYTVLDNEGNPIITNCYDVKHVLYNNQHYFLAKKGKYYTIIQESGDSFSKRNYTKMIEISQNRLLVRVDKKYGIIDLEENVIVPTIYQKFEEITPNIYKTKLNGYFGLIDSKGNVILKNEFDSIKTLNEYILVKKYKKYGLLDSSGKQITEVKYKKIKLERNEVKLKEDKIWEDL